MLPSRSFHSMRLIFYRFLLRSFCKDGFESRWDQHIRSPRNHVKGLSAALRFFVSTFSVSLVQGRQRPA